MGYTTPDATPDEGAAARLAESATMPRAQLRQLVRVPLAQVQVRPPRFGYRNRAFGISDIMNVDEMVAEPPVAFGGTPAGIASTSRNAQGM